MRLSMPALGLVSVFALAACGTEGVNPKPEDLAQLDPPPTGQGFQMETEEIQVPSGVEQQDCYFFKVRDLAAQGGLPPDEPVNLHRIQIAQKDGSHHMNIFRVKTIVGLDPAGGTVKGTNGAGECFKSPNWADWPLVANSQQEGQEDWTYPDGVANEFLPDEWLMLQSHYVNATTQATPDNVAKVRVNFWTMPAAEVTAQLGTLFATKQSIRICQSNPAPTFEGTCQFNSTAPVNIIGANGHFHSRGKQFSMYAWDGVSIDPPPDTDRFYQSAAWDDPPMLHSPDLAVTVPAQGGVFYSCSYNWQPPEPSVGCAGLDQWDQTKYMTPTANLDCCYTFGPIVEKNEHCNIFVYYYPKTDDINCF